MASQITQQKEREHVCEGGFLRKERVGVDNESVAELSVSGEPLVE